VFCPYKYFRIVGQQYSQWRIEWRLFFQSRVFASKKINVKLGELDLTDRQLMAVSLVFYGGLKKNRAARAMNISSQALTDHLKAGLKKIGRSLE
jgi:predicted DNA-binding protein (UPF0251 family)